MPEYLSITLLIILGGLLDRLRGSGVKFGALFGGLGLGALITYLIVPVPEVAAVGAVLFWLGEKPGWGYVVGGILYPPPAGEPEKWQVGPLAEELWIAAVVRGFMWGVPMMFLAYFSPYFLAMPTVTAYAFVASLYCASRLKKFNKWEAMEFIRGTTFVGVAMGLGAL